MTQGQLKRGQDIDQLIEQKLEQLKYWNKAVHFDPYIRVRLKDNEHRWCELKSEIIPFDVVQALVVKKYEQEIAALQEEFNNL